MLFLIASIIFIAFTLCYATFSFALFYHFRQYTVPRHATPAVIGVVFAGGSLLLWYFAVYFLFHIPH